MVPAFQLELLKAEMTNLNCKVKYTIRAAPSSPSPSLSLSLFPPHSSLNGDLQIPQKG